MTSNISYLFDYEPYDGGYVSFGQGGGNITGKGIIKTGKLKFENMYFMKDLKYSLFSVSQIYDNKNSALFTDSECIVLGKDFKLKDDTNVLLRTPRQHNMYSIDLNNIVPHKDLTCLVAKASADESVLWHRRLVMTDDFSRFTWTFFLKTKDETSGILRNFITEIENLKKLQVKLIRYDNEGEFRNKEMNDFCSRKGIKREFNNARTPQQNGVAERRNRTLIEAARIMLADAKLPVTFWAKAVNTTCYVENRVLVNKSQNKTPYELFNGRTPAIGFLKPFGCHVMILNTLDNLGKFDTKGDEGYFIGYSISSKAFRYKDAASQDVKKDVSSLRYIALLNWFHEAHLESSISNAQDTCNADAPESSGNFNPTATSTNPSADHMETLTVESSFPTVSSPVPTACLDDSPEPSSDTNGVEADLGNMENNISASLIPTFRIYKDHPKSQIIGPVDTLVQTRTKSKEMEEQILQKKDGIFLSQDKYVGDILKKFGYSDVRSANTPMDKENHWGKDRTGKDVDLRLYRFMIGSLMYLTASRSDIMFTVCACARHQVTPKECHLHVVKRIFRYLKGHPKLGLWYPKESPFDLVAYSDSDYGGAT
uniref:Ribonuclease H-like domain-containing protein n=1 Tax=Tanacetum cinerariifolium TaxID=118510 RepID=A0A699J959_TANCI|nr:ribonuclease H-like domain-containing protein [Tanacetum cinerariifolium]